MGGAASRGRVFDALGDPTRRRVFELLVHGERAVGEIAREMPVTRPAVSQHLRTLREAGLVTRRDVGRRHLYAVDPAGLAALRASLETYWDSALASFKAAADREGGLA